jgi:hypothetical protein
VGALTAVTYELAKAQAQAADYSHAWNVDIKTALGLIKHNIHQELGLCLHRESLGTPHAG